MTIQQGPRAAVVNAKFARRMFGSVTGAGGKYYKLPDGTRMEGVGIRVALAWNAGWNYYQHNQGSFVGPTTPGYFQNRLRQFHLVASSSLIGAHHDA